MKELVRLDIECSEDRGEQARLYDVSSHWSSRYLHFGHETYIDEISIDFLDPSFDECIAISLGYGSCLRESISLFALRE